MMDSLLSLCLASPCPCLTTPLSMVSLCRLALFLSVNGTQIRHISQLPSHEALKTSCSSSGSYSSLGEIQSKMGLGMGEKKQVNFPQKFSKFIHIKMLSQTFVIINRQASEHGLKLKQSIRYRGTGGDSHFNKHPLQHNTPKPSVTKTLQ